MYYDYYTIFIQKKNMGLVAFRIVWLLYLQKDIKKNAK